MKNRTLTLRPLLPEAAPKRVSSVRISTTGVLEKRLMVSTNMVSKNTVSTWYVHGKVVSMVASRTLGSVVTPLSLLRQNGHLGYAGKLSGHIASIRPMAAFSASTTRKPSSMLRLLLPCKSTSMLPSTLPFKSCSMSSYHSESDVPKTAAETPTTTTAAETPTPTTMATTMSPKKINMRLLVIRAIFLSAVYFIFYILCKKLGLEYFFFILLKKTGIAAFLSVPGRLLGLSGGLTLMLVAGLSPLLGFWVNMYDFSDKSALFVSGGSDEARPERAHSGADSFPSLPPLVTLPQLPANEVDGEFEEIHWPGVEPVQNPAPHPGPAVPHPWEDNRGEDQNLPRGYYFTKSLIMEQLRFALDGKYDRHLTSAKYEAVFRLTVGPGFTSTRCLLAALHCFINKPDGGLARKRAIFFMDYIFENKVKEYDLPNLQVDYTPQ